ERPVSSARRRADPGEPDPAPGLGCGPAASAGRSRPLHCKAELSWDAVGGAVAGGLQTSERAHTERYELSSAPGRSGRPVNYRGNMRSLLKPEYLWRPSQVWRRIFFKPSDRVSSLALPWDCTIRACSAE